MAELGTYYITIMPSMSKFTGAVKSELGDLGTSAGNNFKTSFGDILKGSAIGTMLGSLGSKLGGEIMSGLSTGIRRIDIIQNFPKVMDALGFEAGEAGDSIQLIMDRLDGLPTATQDVVAMTQAFADSTGDLDLATRAALGFNDMMLASGASVGEVTQAQGVLNRVLGKGSATVAQWQSLQSVMPAQLSAVARELGGESMSVEELREALNEGEISWNDFLEAVVKLDTEGSGSVASFRDQAIANSVGIGTALANVQNRIGAGWADILDSIGREDISGAINDFSYGIRDAMYRVGDAIDWLKETIGETQIGESLGQIFGDVRDFFSETFSIDVDDIKGFASAIIDLVDGGLKWLADNGDVVTTALGGIMGALAVLAGWKLGVGLMQLPGALKLVTGAGKLFAALLGGNLPAAIGIVTTGLKTLWAVLTTNPLMLIVTAIGAVTMGLYAFFTQTETGRAIWQGFCDLLSTTWAGLQEDWGVLVTTLQQEWESFKTFIDGIPAWWQGIVDGWNAKVDEWKQWWSKSWDDAVKSVKDAGAAIVTWATQSWTNLKTNTAAKWNEIKANTQQAWQNLKTTISEKVTQVKTAVTQTWDNIKTSTVERWNNIKTAATEKAGAIKTSVLEKFNDLKTSVTEKWNGIKDAISEKITGAKDKVSEMVNAIKRLFDFHISWPHIPLPHFSVSGSANPLDWLKNGVPTISVNWYAKGGVFDGASLIGVGEKGPEAVLPLNERTMGGIADLIANKMDAAPTVLVTGNNFYVRRESDIDAIADAISRRTARQRGARL